MVLLFSLLTFCYSLGVGWLYWHWRQIPFFSSEKADFNDLPFTTIVIPVRNEADSILELLQDMDEQRIGKETYPANKFEVIVVDDASEDSTFQKVKKYQKNSRFPLTLVSLNMPGFSGSHKKMAITRAVESAKGDVIITIDGDCRVGSGWLAAISAFFRQHQPVLVSGPVTFHQERSLFERLQTIEFASLIGVGGASMQARRPNMCNGANLAFSKEAFYAVGGYQDSMHIPSGDDEFLLQKMSKKYPQQIFFLKSRQAVVYTRAKHTVKEFYQQRRRWAGKWKLHKNVWVAALALFIFTFRLVFLIALGMSISGFYPWGVLSAQWLVSVLIEFFFLKDVLHSMKKQMSLPVFLILICIYAPYVVFFGICANFGGYTWKNRPFH